MSVGTLSTHPDSPIFQDTWFTELVKLRKDLPFTPRFPIVNIPNADNPEEPGWAIHVSQNLPVSGLPMHFWKVDSPATRHPVCPWVRDMIKRGVIVPVGAYGGAPIWSINGSNTAAQRHNPFIVFPNDDRLIRLSDTVVGVIKPFDAVATTYDGLHREISVDATQPYPTTHAWLLEILPEGVYINVAGKRILTNASPDAYFNLR